MEIYIDKLKDTRIIKNIHTYPLVNLVTLDTLLASAIGLWLSYVLKITSTSGKVSMVTVSIIMNVWLHHIFDVPTNMGRYMGIDC